MDKQDKHSSVWLDAEAREALEYLQGMPGGFNLSKYVRYWLVMLAKEQGMEE